MKLMTIGKQIYKGYEFPIYYNNNETLSNIDKTDLCFKIIFITNGSGIVIINDTKIIYNAPVILCLNELDFPVLRYSNNFSAQSIFFNPSVINSVFNFVNIRESTDEFSETDIQDRYLLNPFIKRTSKYDGHINLGPSSYKKILNCFNLTADELAIQRDTFWPCRSRLFFLELLVTIVNLYESSFSIIDNKIKNEDEEINKIITYLQLNYNKKISIDDISTMFHMNRTTLNYKFHRATNYSLMTYLIKLRINSAALFLKDTKLPISEIMIRVGFNDNSHFWRMFKKYIGISPKDYRNKYNNK